MLPTAEMICLGNLSSRAIEITTSFVVYFCSETIRTDTSLLLSWITQFTCIVFHQKSDKPSRKGWRNVHID
jgi:hypothetical protein